MRHSETLGAIAPALVKALARIKGAEKDSKNPHFKNDYASLESVINASKEILASEGVTLLQFPIAADAGRVGLETVLVHESGEWITGDAAFSVPLDKPTAQAAGSAISYMRRYAQMSALNIPAVDDDGQAASAPAPQTERKDYGPGPIGKDWWGCDGSGPTAYQAKKEGLDAAHETMRTEIAALTSATEWRRWCGDNTASIKAMPKSWRVELRGDAELMAEELGVDMNEKRA